MWNLWLGSRLDRRGLNYIENASTIKCRTFLMIKIFLIFNKDSRAGKMAPVEGV